MLPREHTQAAEAKQELIKPERILFVRKASACARAPNTHLLWGFPIEV
jgi:hypothetical protein